MELSRDAIVELYGARGYTWEELVKDRGLTVRLVGTNMQGGLDVFVTAPLPKRSDGTPDGGQAGRTDARRHIMRAITRDAVTYAANELKPSPECRQVELACDESLEATVARSDGVSTSEPLYPTGDSPNGEAPQPKSAYPRWARDLAVEVYATEVAGGVYVQPRFNQESPPWGGYSSAVATRLADDVVRVAMKDNTTIAFFEKLYAQ